MDNSLPSIASISRPGERVVSGEGMMKQPHHSALRSPEDTVVLVADDVLSNVQIAGAILSGAGYQVLPASNGEQALRYAKSPSPDLILLDIMMPEMDGFETCRRLKADADTAAIPVIFLTAAEETEYIAEGLKLGAVDYIVKPFNSTELLARVRTHLELKFSRESLERTVRELRELHKEKNDFMGIAAHDLKSPITNFIGLAEYMLIKGELDRAELRDVSESILRESRRLLQLIENLLDLDALERGQLKVHIEPCDLAELAESALENFRPKAEGKQQAIALEVAGKPGLVSADPTVAFQILDNLISNALKFSPRGSSVRIRVFQDATGVLCSVEDQGPGLSFGDQKQLFGKFARLSARPTAGESSTGLGLSIVKKLVQIMHGSVWCESEPGCGAKFVVRFCRAPNP